jgi:hypothetical protein
MDDLQDKDWLDERLAASAYLPDDGFTARVVEGLPQRPRTSICLIASQSIPLFQMVVGLVAGGSLDHLVGLIGKSLHQPIFLAGCGGAMALLTLSAYPFLKRLA